MGSLSAVFHRLQTFFEFKTKYYSYLYYSTITTLTAKYYNTTLDDFVSKVNRYPMINLMVGYLGKSCKTSSMVVR